MNAHQRRLETRNRTPVIRRVRGQNDPFANWFHCGAFEVVVNSWRTCKRNNVTHSFQIGLIRFTAAPDRRAGWYVVPSAPHYCDWFPSFGPFDTPEAALVVMRLKGL